MKKITALIILVASFTPHFAFAQTNPVGITPQEITVTTTRTFDPALQTTTDISAEGEWGKLITDCQIDSRFIGLQAEKWVLNFWNVGSASREEYGKASITITPIFSDFGNIRTNTFTRDDGSTGCAWKEASSPPPLALPHIYSMEFTGGSEGLFKGHDENGLQFTGHIENADTVIFIYDTTKKEMSVRFTLAEKLAAKKSALEDSGTGISDMSGQVEVNIPNEDGTYDEENWQFAKLDGKSFPVGTHIKTSENSSAIISFADLTVFKMKPDTEIVVSSSAAEPDSQIRLLVGNLWTNVKKMAKDGSMEIEMSQAVAGIKGTTFVLEETGDTSTLKVIEGAVSYQSKTGSQTEMVNTGETVTADKNGLGRKTTFDVNAENDSWNNLPDTAGAQALIRNYLYYLGAVALLAVAIATFLIIKRRKK